MRMQLVDALPLRQAVLHHVLHIDIVEAVAERVPELLKFDGLRVHDGLDVLVVAADRRQVLAHVDDAFDAFEAVFTHVLTAFSVSVPSVGTSSDASEM